MGADKKALPGRNREGQELHAPAPTLRRTTDNPAPLSACIAELAEALGIEVTR